MGKKIPQEIFVNSSRHSLQLCSSQFYNTLFRFILYSILMLRERLRNITQHIGIQFNTILILINPKSESTAQRRKKTTQHP